MRAEAAQLGHSFGSVAMAVVPGLMLAGVMLAWQLVGDLSALIATGYGQALLLKIALVGLLLTVAAMNKLRLVPHLRSGVTTGQPLAHAITLEWITVAAILFVTAALTTIFGAPGLA
nr:CopD family protein [Actibacterium sp. 188UL27-1]